MKQRHITLIIGIILMILLSELFYPIVLLTFFNFIWHPILLIGLLIINCLSAMLYLEDKKAAACFLAIFGGGIGAGIVMDKAENGIVGTIIKIAFDIDLLFIIMSIYYLIFNFDLSIPG